jgi:hypothetical protein
MNINEIFGHTDKLDFDLVDDVVYFINNDEEFYRKYAFPVVDKFVHLCKKGKTPSVGYFKVLANNGYKEYQVKFPHSNIPEKLPSPDLRDMCHKLFKQEFDRFHDKNQPSLDPSDPVSEQINSIKALAGITSTRFVEQSTSNGLTPSQKTNIMKEHNIRPGDDAWFRLWFARTAITGELPFGGYDNNEF